MAVQEGGRLSDAEHVEDSPLRHARQIRRATELEKARACFIRHVNVDSVAEAWIDCSDRVELVLHGFTDRVMVPLNYKESV